MPVHLSIAQKALVVAAFVKMKTSGNQFATEVSYEDVVNCAQDKEERARQKTCTSRNEISNAVQPFVQSGQLTQTEGDQIINTADGFLSQVPTGQVYVITKKHDRGRLKRVEMDAGNGNVAKLWHA
jgi:hypothetical protein